MATKSLLLSCLVMGLGIAQHPVSEGTQTQYITTITVTVTATATAGFATSTDLPLPPEEWGCEFSPEDLTKHNELTSRVLQMPKQSLAKCIFLPGALDTPECEPAKSLADFHKQKCPNIPPVYRLSNILERANSSDSWTVEPVGHPVLDNTKLVDSAQCELSPQELEEFDQLYIRFKQQPSSWKCSSGEINPDEPECKAAQELDDFLAQRCFVPLDNLLHIRENANRDRRDSRTIGPPDHSSFNLEQQGADEPYHPTLKAIYDDCDVLEDSEEHTMCVLAKLERALCDQEPWIPLCHYSEPGSADEFSSKSNIIDNDLLDEIFDTDAVVSVADNDDFPRRPQVTAAPEPTEAARPIKWLPGLGLEPFFQECEDAGGFNSPEDCMYEKMRDEVCSRNPEDELCELPGPALVNEHDLPPLHQDR